MNTQKKKSPFVHSNVKLFVAFRLFFNSRFYYPVFSILFLDFGLTLSQFAVLNSVWAATIVVCEVPSGALADIVGRRNLLVFSAILMVSEMALLAFAPRGDANLLFLFFLANRILSGMAEASASGADEALAYDTLVRDGDVRDWGIVLEKQMLARSVGFIFAMIVGAAVYDPSLMQTASDFLGLGMTFDKNATLRLPLYLTLALALCALGSTLLMKEIHPVAGEEAAGGSKPVAEAFRLTFQAGRWILHTPFVLAVMLTGLVFDCFSRMLITMGSQYYRTIGIPEAMFGFIGSVLAVGGIFIPRIARRLSEGRTPGFNVAVMATVALAGMGGMAMAWPLFGLVPALLVFCNMYFNNFFASYYLNRETRSDQRATVLSFKGLAYNLAYGAVGILYSLLLSFLRPSTSSKHPELAGEALKNAVFVDSLAWFPACFAIALLVAMAFSRWKLAKA